MARSRRPDRLSRPLSIASTAAQLAVRRAVHTALMQGAQVIADDAANSIYEGPKTGRVYASRWRKGARHQASAPGEAPAADSGRLAQSITIRPRLSADTVDVGSDTTYAAPLEYGTSRMAPRPFLGPAFRRNRSRVATHVATAMRRALAQRGVT